jgi:hypothetical protein
MRAPSACARAIGTRGRLREGALTHHTHTRARHWKQGGTHAWGDTLTYNNGVKVCMFAYVCLKDQFLTDQVFVFELCLKLNYIATIYLINIHIYAYLHIFLYLYKLNMFISITKIQNHHHKQKKMLFYNDIQQTYADAHTHSILVWIYTHTTHTHAHD